MRRDISNFWASRCSAENLTELQQDLRTAALEVGLAGPMKRSAHAINLCGFVVEDPNNPTAGSNRPGGGPSLSQSNHIELKVARLPTSFRAARESYEDANLHDAERDRLNQVEREPSRSDEMLRTRWR